MGCFSSHFLGENRGPNHPSPSWMTMTEKKWNMVTTGEPPKLKRSPEIPIHHPHVMGAMNGCSIINQPLIGGIKICPIVITMKPPWKPSWTPPWNHHEITMKPPWNHLFVGGGPRPVEISSDNNASRGGVGGGGSEASSLSAQRLAQGVCMFGSLSIYRSIDLSISILSILYIPSIYPIYPIYLLFDLSIHIYTI